MTTPNETQDEPDTDASTRRRWGLTPEELATVRARAREAMKNSGHDFKRFKQGSEALRELDAVVGKDGQP